MRKFWVINAANAIFFRKRTAFLSAVVYDILAKILTWKQRKLGPFPLIDSEEKEEN